MHFGPRAVKDFDVYCLVLYFLFYLIWFLIGFVFRGNFLVFLCRFSFVMLNFHNSYYAKKILILFVVFNQSIYYMKLLVFPSRSDTYNSIVIDTDKLDFWHEFGKYESLPSLFLDDLITDLIEKN